MLGFGLPGEGGKSGTLVGDGHEDALHTGIRFKPLLMSPGQSEFIRLLLLRGMKRIISGHELAARWLRVER